MGHEVTPSPSVATAPLRTTEGFVPQKHSGIIESIPEGVHAIIRELARQYDYAELIDQQALMPASGRYYLDVCHLTIDGATRWVEHVLRPLGHAAPEVATRSGSYAA